jgi:hypothetical protein
MHPSPDFFRLLNELHRFNAAAACEGVGRENDHASRFTRLASQTESFPQAWKSSRPLSERESTIPLLRVGLRKRTDA